MLLEIGVSQRLVVQHIHKKRNECLLVQQVMKPQPGGVRNVRAENGQVDVRSVAGGAQGPGAMQDYLADLRKCFSRAADGVAVLLIQLHAGAAFGPDCFHR